MPRSAWYALWQWAIRSFILISKAPANGFFMSKRRPRRPPLCEKMREAGQTAADRLTVSGDQ
jgi:hypothetical protein